MDQVSTFCQYMKYMPAKDGNCLQNGANKNTTVFLLAIDFDLCGSNCKVRLCRYLRIPSVRLKTPIFKGTKNLFFHKQDTRTKKVG